MLHREQKSGRIEEEPSRESIYAQKAALSFEDLVVDGSLTPVSIQMMLVDADKPTGTPEEGLLTELQCEV